MEITQILVSENIEYLIELIGQSIDEADEFLGELDISLDEINKLPGDLEKLEALRNALEIIYQKDEGKEKFRVITNTMLNLYEASKPEIFEMGWQNEKFKPLKYLNDLMNNNVDDDLQPHPLQNPQMSDIILAYEEMVNYNAHVRHE